MLSRGDRVVILAGAGDFPLLLARALKEKGCVVSAVAFRGETSEAVSSVADSVRWTDVGSLAEVIEAIRESASPNLILSGKIEHKYIFTKKLDGAAAELFASRPDARAENLLESLAGKFAQMGVKVLPQSSALEHLLAPKGFLSRRRPTEGESADVELGRKIASALAGLDCGQTVAVKNGVVVALEGAEGTDETIKRAGAIAGRGIVVVKMSRPRQDMRFDVPVAGADTLRTAFAAGATVVAVEAGKTLLLDPDAMKAFADENDMVFIGI
jgi:hypothetical protein